MSLFSPPYIFTNFQVITELKSLMNSIHNSPKVIKSLSIDPGPCNNAWLFTASVIEEDKVVVSILDHGIERLEDQAKTKDGLVKGIVAFLGKVKRYLEEADEVLVEFQMPKFDKPEVFVAFKNNIIEMVIRSHVEPEKLAMCYPAAIKSYYGIASGIYAKNKSLAVEKALEFGGKRDPHKIWAQYPAYQKNHLADCLIQLWYHLEVSNQIKDIRLEHDDQRQDSDGQTSPQLPPTLQAGPRKRSPPNDRVEQDKRHRRNQQETSGQRTLSSFLQ